MEYDSSWYRPTEFILLLLSTILQIVSISTPWWQIETYTERPSNSIGRYGFFLNATEPEERLYRGVFYSTKCNASICETKTLHERNLEAKGKYFCMNTLFWKKDHCFFIDFCISLFTFYYSTL